jgi:hypothetical protein
MKRRTLLGALATVIPSLALREMASAQVGGEAIGSGDGFDGRSDHIDAANCSIGPVSVYNGSPGSGNENDVQCSAPFNCGRANDDRILRVRCAVDNGDGTYRVFESQERTVGASRSPSGTITTTWNESCGAGTGDFAGIIVKKIQGGNTYQEAGPTVTLNSNPDTCV